MLYTFYNKQTPICNIEYSEGYGFSPPKKLLNPEFAPYGLDIPGFRKTNFFIQDWWQNRLIPKSRKNFDVLNLLVHSTSLSNLAIKNFGLSLSDQYWFCPAEITDILWDDINYFQNPFVSDLNLDIPEIEKGDIFSPDLSTNGNLPKKWVIIKDVRYLCKGTTAPFHQEAVNELIASKILDELQIPHTEYYCENNVSFCPCFIDEDTEFVPAWHIVQSNRQLNHENSYQFFCRICDEFNVEYKKYLNQIILFDFLISNVDRHYNNFGFIRNVTSLKMTQFSPIFDNGCSLWYDTLDNDVGCMSESKPFNKKFTKQIEYVDDKSIIHLSCNIEDIVQNTFIEYGFSLERAEKISEAVSARKNYILSLQ